MKISKDVLSKVLGRQFLEDGIIVDINVLCSNPNKKINLNSFLYKLLSKVGPKYKIDMYGFGDGTGIYDVELRDNFQNTIYKVEKVFGPDGRIKATIECFEYMIENDLI
jgi:hypothetical protein